MIMINICIKIGNNLIDNLILIDSINQAGLFNFDFLPLLRIFVLVGAAVGDDSCTVASTYTADVRFKNVMPLYADREA